MREQLSPDYGAIARRRRAYTPLWRLHPGYKLLAAAMLLCALAIPAQAETLRVGKAVGVAFSFAPLDIGVRKGLFAREGLEIESIVFGGDARMQQAMAADGIDVALGSGPAMAFIAKGAPVKGIAAMAGPPLLLTVIVRPTGREAWPSSRARS